jgi:uncharacterized membrane-anchored protein YitT (DUF2179 family)
MAPITVGHQRIASGLLLGCSVLMLATRIEFIMGHGWTWNEPLYLANWCFLGVGFIVSRRGLVALRGLPSEQLFSEAAFPPAVFRRDALWLASAAVLSVLASIAAVKETDGRLFNVMIAALFGAMALSGADRWRRTSSG